MMFIDAIDYSRIAKAQMYYKALGYQNVEVPWLASHQAVRATLPPDTRSLNMSWSNSEKPSRAALIGSGEQGFIELMLLGRMDVGRYQTTTPCFRDEKVYSELTKLAFVKTELIWYKPDDVRAAYEKVLNDALACFFEISDCERFEAVQTEDGYDIFCNGIELGSYGVREMKEQGHLWIYGTGIAEPRFSLTMRKMQQVEKAEPEPEPDPCCGA